MAMSIKFNAVFERVAVIFLARFPFVNALTLLMLLAERAPTERYPPIHHQLIYVHLFLFVVCGFLLSARLVVKHAALIYAGQLLYFAYTFYANNKFNYDHWLKIQMSTKQVGCAGIYILFGEFLVKINKSGSHHADDASSSKQLQRIGEILIGLYLFSYSFILNSSTKHKEAFLYHCWQSEWLQYLLTLALLVCALCFIAGFFVRDICFCAIFAHIILTLMLDCDITYWTERGVHYWNQVRMLGDSVCAIFGFIFLASVSYNRPFFLPVLRP